MRTKAQVLEFPLPLFSTDRPHLMSSLREGFIKCSSIEFLDGVQQSCTFSMILATRRRHRTQYAQVMTLTPSGHLIPVHARLVPPVLCAWASRLSGRSRAARPLAAYNEESEQNKSVALGLVNSAPATRLGPIGGGNHNTNR